MEQRVITYTPKENKDPPNFLPVIDMVQVIEELDYWCKESLNFSVFIPNINVDDYWVTIGSNLEINIWRPDPDDIGSPPKIAAYPVDDKRRTDEETWCDIHNYTMNFLKSHPELETDYIYIKQWFQGRYN